MGTSGAVELRLIAEIRAGERQLAPKTLRLRELAVREWHVVRRLPDGNEVLVAAPAAWPDV